jgi:hypothetical protein
VTVVTWYPDRVDAFMRNPSGPVARDSLARADRVRAEAYRRVGKDTGLLASTIRVQQLNPPVSLIVAGAAGRTPYLGPHMRGAGPHIIRVRRRKTLRFIQGGRVRFPVAVRHPGNQPNDFLREALSAAR